ncbi:hypothetical protein BH23ACT8_BH23ACT8_15660 [soil metagenome]
MTDHREPIPHTAKVYVEDGVARVRVHAGDSLLHDDPVAGAAHLDPRRLLDWTLILDFAEEQVAADYPLAAGTWATNAAGGETLFWDEEDTGTPG